MKSEHRHELQRNELGKLTTAARPYAEHYGKYVLAGLGVLTLAILGITWWMNSSRAEAAVAWTKLLQADSSHKAEDYAKIADDFANRPAGHWAKLKEAEVHLDSGARLVFTNREAGVADLKEAREAFEALLNTQGIADEIRERALVGLGRTLESLSTGDTSEAVAVYQKLVDQFPTSIYRGFAEERIKALESNEAKEFYAWFAEQNPKPPEPGRPRDGQLTPPPPQPAPPKPTSGTEPVVPNETPAAINQPDATPKTDTPKSDTPKSDTPKSDTPPAESPAEKSPPPAAQNE